MSEQAKGDVIVFYLLLFCCVLAYNLFRRYFMFEILARKVEKEKSLNENKGKIIGHENDLSREIKAEHST